MTEATTPAAPAEAPKPGPETAIPDMIRLLSGGQIGVDDERWLGVNIPTGTPFYSEVVVEKLRAELADARELAASLRQAESDESVFEEREESLEGPRHELDLNDFLMSLPVNILLSLAQTAMNHLTLEQLAKVCFAHGFQPTVGLVASEG